MALISPIIYILFGFLPVLHLWRNWCLNVCTTLMSLLASSRTQIRSSRRGQALSCARKIVSWRNNTLITCVESQFIKIFWLDRNIYDETITFTSSFLLPIEMYSLDAQGVEFFLNPGINNVLFITCATACHRNFSYAIKHVIVQFKKWFFQRGFRPWWNYVKVLLSRKNAALFVHVLLCNKDCSLFM